MQRGVLTLNKNELEEVKKHIDLDKFNIAFENIKDENRIFVNSEELEYILDEIGNMKTEVDQPLKTVIQKISELLLSFRN